MPVGEIVTSTVVTWGLRGTERQAAVRRRAHKYHQGRSEPVGASGRRRQLQLPAAGYAGGASSHNRPWRAQASRCLGRRQPGQCLLRCAQRPVIGSERGLRPAGPRPPPSGCSGVLQRVLSAPAVVQYRECPADRPWSLCRVRFPQMRGDARPPQQGVMFQQAGESAVGASTSSPEAFTMVLRCTPSVAGAATGVRAAAE